MEVDGGQAFRGHFGERAHRRGHDGGESGVQVAGGVESLEVASEEGVVQCAEVSYWEGEEVDGEVRIQEARRE